MHMNIGFGEPHAYTGGVVFDVCVDEDVIGTATNAGTPRRTFQLDVTDEWAIDEYLLEGTFDFKAATPRCCGLNHHPAAGRGESLKGSAT